MQNPAEIVAQSATLKATAILDIDHEAVRSTARMVIEPDQTGRSLLQQAHMLVSRMVRPVSASRAGG